MRVGVALVHFEPLAVCVVATGMRTRKDRRRKGPVSEQQGGDQHNPASLTARLVELMD